MKYNITVKDTNGKNALIMDDGKRLSVKYGLFWKRTEGDFDMEYSQIADISIIRKDEMIQKQKSVIGRALVGGMLFGGVGAVVGGMSGIGNKEKILQHLFLDIELNDGTKHIFAINDGNTNQDIIILHVQKYLLENK